MTAALRCSAAPNVAIANGLNSLRMPFVPVLAATLKLAQLSVAALNGDVGPRPPLMGLKLPPAPPGMAKQLVHSVPIVALVPSPQVADCTPAPGVRVPGSDDASGTRLSSPQ